MSVSTSPMAPESAISAMDAIYRRRAVRDYTHEKVDKAAIHALLDAAVHAPTAMHEEPCAFAIVQDKVLLNRLSNCVKDLLARGIDPIHPRGGKLTHDQFTARDFNVFYNASTLIVIYGKSMGPLVAADCWLAAENLLLACVAHGLGACVIGLAVTALNTQEWKKELGVDAGMTAYAPIILGMPAAPTPQVPRKPPEIFTWK